MASSNLNPTSFILTSFKQPNSNIIHTIQLQRHSWTKLIKFSQNQLTYLTKSIPTSFKSHPICSIINTNKTSFTKIIYQQIYQLELVKMEEEWFGVYLDDWRVRMEVAEAVEVAAVTVLAVGRLPNIGLRQ